MDKKAKAKWVKALRGGKYKQCKNYLARGGYHCCLGVACDLGIAKKSYDAEQLCMPNNFIPYDDQKRLAMMNDSKTPFSEIADYIEENL